MMIQEICNLCQGVFLEKISAGIHIYQLESGDNWDQSKLIFANQNAEEIIDLKNKDILGMKRGDFLDKNIDDRFMVSKFKINEKHECLMFEKILDYDHGPDKESINNSLYNKLFDYMYDGLAFHKIILDDNGRPCDYRFLRVNKAFETLTGLKKENIIGKRVLEVLPQTENYWIDTYGRVALSGKSINFHNFSKELNKYFEVKAYSPAKNYFAVVFVDITEEILEREREKKAQMNYLRNSKWASLGQLVGGIAHEINNPLTIIKSYIDLLEEELRSNGLISQLDDQSRFNKIGDSISRITSIIKMLKNYAKTNFEIAEIKLNDHLMMMTELISIIAKKDQASIYFELSQDDLVVKGNSEAFQQIILNLIYNAVESYAGSPSKGEKSIVIKSYQKKSSVVIEIIDKGKGIDPLYLDKIFDPFFTTKEVGKGTGMGLCIVQSYLKDMNGEIEVESKLEKGTVIRLVFTKI